MHTLLTRGHLIAALTLIHPALQAHAAKPDACACGTCATSASPASRTKPVPVPATAKPEVAFATPVPSAPPAQAAAPEGCQCPDCAKDRAAAPSAPLSFTVESAVARALEANRDLRAAAFIVDEAQGRLDGAGLMPNPELETGFAPGVTASGAYRFSAGITQRFPITGRLRLARELAASEVAAAREEVNAAKRDLIGAVKSEAVEAIALTAELRLLAARSALADEAAKSAAALAAGGAQSPLDTSYAELALADAKAESARVESARAAALDRLKTRLGFAPNAPIAITGELPEPDATPGARPALAAEDCPDFRRGKILADGADTAVRLAEARRTGDIGVGLYGEIERETGGSSNNPAGFVGVKVSIPLPLWDDNRGEIRSARARRERLQAELAAENLRTEGASAAAWGEYTRLGALMRPLRTERLPAARALTERIRDSRTRGEVGYAELLRAREKEAELETRLLTLRRDAALAYIRWETASAAHPALKARIGFVGSAK